MLKKMAANCGADINKKPINITVFRRSYFNHFYRHFRKFWIEKKIVAVDTKLSFQVKQLLIRVVPQGNCTLVGRFLKAQCQV